MATMTLHNDTVLVDAPLQETACVLVRDLGDAQVSSLVLRAGGQDFEFPASLAKLAMHVVQAAAEGGALTIKTLPEEVTTTVAADMLGLSRPTLMKMIAEGQISGRKVGTHTRLASQDVVKLSKKRADARRTAFDPLRELQDELGEK